MKNRLTAIVGLFTVLSIIGFTHQANSNDRMRSVDRAEHRMHLILVGEDETVTKRIPEPAAQQPFAAPINTTTASLRATYSLQRVEGHSAAITLRQLVDNTQKNAVIESSEQTLTVTADVHTQKLVIDLIAAMDAAK